MRLLLDTSALLHLAAGTLSPGAAAELPLIHRDPFDRILVATALRDNLAVLTPDRAIAMYPVATIW
jgi:PIN domain nuclease of toxin-antitoxin system